MSEFFTKTNQPDYWVSTAQELENRSQEGREAIMEQAAALQEPIAHLVAELQRRGIAPNTAVVAVEREAVGRAQRAWRKQFRWDTTTYHAPARAQVLGRGWLISTTSVRSGKGVPSSITVLENGDLVLGGSIVQDKDGDGNVIRQYAEPYREATSGQVSSDAKSKILNRAKKEWHYVPDGELNPALDLNSYPIHPVFATEYEYIDVRGNIPQLVRDGSVDLHTPEANVVSNLERLEVDLRNAGRELLGYN